MTTLREPFLGIEKIKYLFIDGGALDSILQQFSDKLFNKVPVEIDYLRLANGFQKVFYYNSLPAQRKNEKDDDYKERLKPTIKYIPFIKLININIFRISGKKNGYFTEKKSGKH